MRNIIVIGTGYVGLSTGICFADLGNNVTCLDINEEKIQMLREGEAPIYEPGLNEMLARNIKAKRLHFTTDYVEALKEAEFVFICVGTPSGVDGEADLQYVRMAAESIAQHMQHPIIVVNKSTVPVGTGDWVAEIITRSQPQPIEFNVVSCPEFSREGSALHDFMHADRVVLGSRNPEAAEKVAHLHLPLRTRLLVTDLRTAEMIKYASNAFLATKISFINEMAAICEKLGADVHEVAVGMGYDHRIGSEFLNAGLGYGGSCFTSDETLFALNSPTVKTQSIADLFEQEPGTRFQGDEVELLTPRDKHVVAFDLETGQPTIANVTAITRRPYKGFMVNIGTSMGRSLSVTADHPVILKFADGFHTVPAATVSAGDQLMALCELPEVEPMPPVNIASELRRELVRGTFRDDGGSSSLEQNENLMYEYAAVSKQLADGMAFLLQSLGIVVSIRERWMNKSTRVAYILRVSGYSQLEKLKDVFGGKHRAKIDDILAGYKRQIKQRGFTRSGPYAQLKVLGVEYQEAETSVYSVETSTGTLIASSGLICHNCFPKDVKALEHMALIHGSHPSLLRAVIDINRDARRWAVLNLREALGGSLNRKKIGVLGLAFKPNTDDIRESPALEIARMLQNEGALVTGYDPVAMKNAMNANPDLRLVEDAYELADGADALLVCTEWNEFKHLDLARVKTLMAQPVVVDGRNIYEPERMQELGFQYCAVGR